MYNRIIIILTIFLISCSRDVEKTQPVRASISESIYASGIVKSRNQYQVFVKVNGIVEEIYVSEGDSVMAGSPILSVSNQIQKLNKENAELTAEYSDFKRNQEKLEDANLSIELARNKMNIDSSLYFRQKSLWQQKVGTKVELEQRELSYQNSQTIYYSSIVRYNELKRQLNFNSAQSKKNLMISSELEDDYTLRSEIDGIIYSLTKSKGELVNTQTPVATIGDAKNFILEMQVDEYDILKIKKGLSVLVTLDSYKGKVFEAVVTKINPLMNERSKTFLVEADFINPPEILYPNITFEANIVIQSKNEAILIPRNYMIGDSLVIKSNGDTIAVETGLKDYQNAEIISGLNMNDELILPAK